MAIGQQLPGQLGGWVAGACSQGRRMVGRHQCTENHALPPPFCIPSLAAPSSAGKTSCTRREMTREVIRAAAHGAPATARQPYSLRRRGESPAVLQQPAHSYVWKGGRGATAEQAVSFFSSRKHTSALRVQQQESNCNFPPAHLYHLGWHLGWWWLPGGGYCGPRQLNVTHTTCIGWCERGAF